MELPQDIDPQEFDETYRTTPQLWLAAVTETCSMHGLPTHPQRAFSDGSNLVAAVAEHFVVKLFPPFHRHQWESERRFLEAVPGNRIPITVPTLLASGIRPDGWPYVIVSLLAGTSLESVWHTFTHREKARALEAIGTVIAAVHTLSPGDLRTLSPQWAPFFAAQMAGCRARHVRLGLPEHLLRGLDAFLQDALPTLPTQFTPRILTGEYTPFNLMAQQGSDGWVLSGMIDFGDVMVGPGEYDLLGPSVFLAEGDRELVRALFRGYGLADGVLTGESRRRLLALLLLHRYSNLNFQVRIPDWQSRAGSLDELAQLIWPS